MRELPSEATGPVVGLQNVRQKLRWEECDGRQQSFARNSALMPLDEASFWG